MAVAAALGFMVFVFNAISSRKNVIHDPDPWDARTLEWGTSSPPPAHNYDIEPTVTSLDAPTTTRHASFLMVSRAHVRLVALSSEESFAAENGGEAAGASG